MVGCGSAAAEPPNPATAPMVARLIRISVPRRSPPLARPALRAAEPPFSPAFSAPARLRLLMTLRTDSGVRTRQAPFPDLTCRVGYGTGPWQLPVDAGRSQSDAPWGFARDRQRLRAACL